MLAVLWTRAPEAALSHETALDVDAISDIVADTIHLTVANRRRRRRLGGGRHEVHRQDLDAGQIGWWEQVPTVTAATAIVRCIECGTPTHLLRKALERGRGQGRITGPEREDLAARLAARDE
ncbi:MAG: hypothetical protein B7X41_03230 [Microbacterium sp. 14-71-5]|nr:MAG: hypothetical protein B7X41_03230 [Microbacterium sp. 14-71-5]